MGWTSRRFSSHVDTLMCFLEGGGVVFEQLEDDFFYNLYQAREVAQDNVGQHEVVDLAVIPLSISRIEFQVDIIFFCHHDEDFMFDSVVIGYDGRECFMLTSQRGSQLKAEVTIQCSSLINVVVQRDIVKFVLSELGLSKESLSWISTDVELSLEDTSFVDA